MGTSAKTEKSLENQQMNFNFEILPLAKASQAIQKDSESENISQASNLEKSSQENRLYSEKLEIEIDQQSFNFSDNGKEKF